MFGIIKSMSHRKLLRQHKNRSLDLNVFIISNVQFFLRVRKGTESWNTYPLKEKVKTLSECLYFGRRLQL